MLGTVAIVSFTLINKTNLFYIQVSKGLSWEMDKAKQIYNDKSVKSDSRNGAGDPGDLKGPSAGRDGYSEGVTSKLRSHG